MSWVAVAIGGSALLGAGASMYAADKQAGAAGAASGMSQQQFAATSANLQPYVNQGVHALGQMGTQFGTPTSPGNKPFSLADFQQSPAYQFNLEQGMNAINKGAAARGNLYAPQTLQDLGKYAQGTASNEYQNAFSNYNTNQNNLFSRLQTLSGQGANAASGLGGFGAQTAGQVGANMIGAGNAQAAGIVGGTNAISGGVGDYYNYRLMQQILGQQQRPTYGEAYSNSNPGGVI